MELTDRIAEMLAPSLQAMGYDLVRVQLMGGNRAVLQIMADRLDEAPMTVEDCADISRSVSALLDVEDPIKTAYTLEVSSPGIDRPLVRARDFERYAGFEAKLDAKVPVEGRKRFRGRLLGLDADGAVVMDTDAGELHIAVADIARAKLILTDELIAASQAAHDSSKVA
ncbi:MAG: ribosome maturation factor RimP [Oceanibaculum sp.]